ncbi:MAG TPA: Eco29kI family restriction endonuclease [Candidatus Binataceae bacterium]|nr:Eco29kI family restriction endonuclease [Candidatus Binataceae bacterium]
MAGKRVFNPLDKRNLGINVADALIVEEVEPLGEVKPFKGAGIYAMYYRGGFPAYRQLAARNRAKFVEPIYVGKAVPAGARKGGFGLGEDPGQVLFQRLREHAETIRQVEASATKTRSEHQLKIADFFCRYLLVDDIWIPLGESMLIDRFHPIWNKVVDGFGNHDPGKGRYRQQRSPWDTVHPGRAWASKCQPYAKTVGQILEVVAVHFARHSS